MKKIPSSLLFIRIVAAIFSMTLSGAAFSGAGVWLGQWLKLQAAPAFQRAVTIFSLGALLTLVCILLLTLTCGRLYCSILCPLGIGQDLFGSLRPKSGSPLPPFRRTRYFLAALIFGAAAGGWSAGLLLFDPYANFGRIMRPFTGGALAVLLVLLLAAIWKKRLFCAFLCPVGTLLGLPARRALLQLRITAECVKCELCVKRCPAGCIDLKEQRIDNERCVRCLACLGHCPKGAIQWYNALKKKDNEFSRREFLKNGGILLAGFAAGAALAQSGKFILKKLASRLHFLPPGAAPAERFAARCTGCQLCVASCPAGIIVPAPGGIGPVSLDLTRGACRFDCHSCGEVCPTGAIPNLSLAVKQKTPIAKAVFDAENCLVFQNDEACDLCARACPVHAVTLRKNGTPRPVKTDLCIGCGACYAACPAPKKAYTIIPLEKRLISATARAATGVDARLRRAEWSSPSQR